MNSVAVICVCGFPNEKHMQEVIVRRASEKRWERANGHMGIDRISWSLPHQEYCIGGINERMSGRMGIGENISGHNEDGF